MEYDEIMAARLLALEARMGALEQRQASLERGATAKPRRKRELSPEERANIRTRLIAGQEKARAKKEAEAKAQAKAAKKEAANEG